MRLYLVDGSGYIFRAFHALPPLTRKSDGLPVGAVQGFCNMLWKLICDTKDGDDGKGLGAPTHLAVVFDASEKTFRSKIYEQYKAHRPPPPADLIPQFPLIREATRAFGVPAIELEGYEADDVIATYARRVAQAGGEVVVVSSDKDLMQLVNEQICLLDPVKQVRICREQVIEKFGVPPERVVEVQALAGDSVDNVPGAPGIGIKTAVQLLEEFGDLDSLLARAGEIKQPKRRETLLTHADQVRISRQLVTLADDAPVPDPVSDFVVRAPDPAVLAQFLNEMEFRTLARRVSEASPGMVPAPMVSAPQAVAIDPTAYVCIQDLETLDAWIARAFEAGVIAFDTETDSLSSAASGLCGVSLATAPGQAVYIPLGHCAAEGLDLMAAQDWTQIPMSPAIARLKPLLEDPSVLKVAQNAKYDLAVMSRYGVDVAPIEDTMLMSYVLDAGLHGHGMDELSQIHLGHIPIPFKQVAGSGKKEISFAQVELKTATAYAAEDADVTLRLYHVLKPRLLKAKLLTVYETLERGMPPVLAAMECHGIKVDPDRLRALSHEFGIKMVEAEARAHQLAGHPFNLGSPKQIGDVLFGELGLPGAKRTATGAWSTDVKVMEDLAEQGHDLPRAILDWRQIAKLKNTYTDALVLAVAPATGRVHTSFSLASTTTGRLSSSDPNLQNIPIRTDEGRKLRTCFIAEPGNVIVSADYSQIELRLLAHIGDIPQLKDAFRRGLDIHAMTASEMFGVPVEGMDPMVRRRAKAINFGIIYGISAFGLSNQLGIRQDEAGAYIRTYFERFPGIRDYMDKTRALVREQGFVTTLFGRRINIPEIASKSAAQRQFSERAAINAPIQGAAADIIRRAMMRMPAALKTAGLSARMLLQVHDELVFEAPKAEADALCKLAAEVMSGAAEPAVALSVPLTVDARWAANWDEAH
ncbi:DNA polymerase I [Caulobacter sp. S45]|uniref:DNA polymerase I n=1 Tax=Caulobacter sp. S45 TaxID=1641861 RepID=UPI0020B16197|nr:DNA polymerase I [Caulobacter sp. S45]